jgi:hypothetical protein
MGQEHRVSYQEWAKLIGTALLISAVIIITGTGGAALWLLWLIQ